MPYCNAVLLNYTFEPSRKPIYWLLPILRSKQLQTKKEASNYDFEHVNFYSQTCF